MKYTSLKHWMLILLPLAVATSVFATDGPTGGAGGADASADGNTADTSKGIFACLSDGLSTRVEFVKERPAQSILILLCAIASGHYAYNHFLKDADEEEEEGGVTA